MGKISLYIDNELREVNKRTTAHGISIGDELYQRHTYGRYGVVQVHVLERMLKKMSNQNMTGASFACILDNASTSANIKLLPSPNLVN